MKYASGKHAQRTCDRCGFAYPYPQGKKLIVNGKRTGLIVCPECYEPDHPQYQVSRLKLGDAEALRDPRPDEDEVVP